MDSSAPWRALDAGEPAPAADRSEPHRRRIAAPLLAVAAGTALALCAAVVVLAAVAAPAAPVAVTGGSPPAAVVTAGPGLVVEVTGAVLRPGVYELPGGARVRDAIEQAGGYGPDVDASAAEATLNLAAKVTDGQVIRVPRRGEGHGSPSAAAKTTAGLINLNTATAEQLDSLPGVGPVTAAKIVAAREEKPFTAVDDLVTRKILSASALAKVRSLVTVS